MLESFLLKGIVIGILFGMPIGAVGALTTRRILVYGPKVGILSGMGSSVADCLYACIGVFGLTLISDILIKNQFAVNLIGGLFIFLLGIRLIIKRAEEISVKKEKNDILKMFLSSFFIGITNPASILTFLFAFSYFEIPANLSLINRSQIVAGVFVGTLLWWILLSAGIGVLQSKGEKNSICRMNTIFGILLVIFSVVVILKGIYKIF